MDYRACAVQLNGYRVKQLCVVSLAAERFWFLAFRDRRGMGSLAWGDVASVELHGASVSGRTRSSLVVGLTRADSELALRVARAVVSLVERHGFRVLDAVVPQKSAVAARVGRVGEHDLVCERRAGARGLSSVEVKLRQVNVSGRLPVVRRQVQLEAWAMWPDTKADTQRAWAERLCVLLVWGPGNSFSLGDWSDAYGEAIPASAEECQPEMWMPVWGWAGALPAASDARALATTSARVRAAQKVEAKAKADKKKAFDRAYAQCRTVVKHGREMRSVSDLLNGVRTDRARRVRPTIGEKLGVWQRKWQWPPRSYDTDARAASRSGGGSYGYVATKPALSDIHEFVLG
jgi:hypothetical protein